MKEKEKFEEKETAEENEPMEVETLEKEERLERVSRRKITWLTNKLCKDILTEIVNSMETAVTVSMMEKLLEEVVAKVEEDGNVNINVNEVEEHGQAFRNRVEEALKSRRRTEEAVLRALVEDGEREQRLEERQQKKAEWARRFCQLESERMKAKLEGSGIRKKTSFARKSSKRLLVIDGDREVEDAGQHQGRGGSGGGGISKGTGRA